ncbi:phage protease [Arthrobacter sp. AL12]|uniref:phage protease n=1 Tax=Arthrobacter sp. AL12 TaxID=3042241 RepID=UPI00249AA0CB|nr:phage protease [Arthrobacter sp. AL12]MDI3211771.1 phage protease [Arthrobacter sp. AL12]
MKTSKSIRLTQRVQASVSGELPQEIELIHTGSWRTPWHGDFDVTEADIDEAVGHFDAGVYRVRGTEPLPGTLDHLGGDSPAAFRINALRRAGDRMLAAIDWTTLGKEKIERDEYRYISVEFYPASMPFENPEVEGEMLKNVVTGATLTNDPLLKKLKPVMASARAGDGDKHKGETMTLEEIRAKQVAELTDEEKAFLAEHKSELTAEELKTYGLEEDDEAAKAAAAKEAAEKEAADKEAADKAAAEAQEAEASQKLEASAKKLGIDLKQLQADAKAGREAKEQLAKNEAVQFVQASVASGRVKSDQQDNAVSLLLASSGKHRTALEAFITSLPENPMLKAEAGSGKGEAETEVVITDEEKDLGSDFGNSAEDIAAFKKAQSESK